MITTTLRKHTTVEVHGSKTPSQSPELGGSRFFISAAHFTPKYTKLFKAGLRQDLERELNLS